MKKIVLLRGIIFLIVAALFLSGCAQHREIISLGSGAAVQGINITEKTVNVYEKIKSFRCELDKEKEIYNSLVNHDLDMPLNYHRVDDLSDIFTYRVRAFENLGEVYSAFNKLSDSAYSKNASATFDSLAKSINSLKSVPQLPSRFTKGIADETTDKIKAALSHISESNQAKNIKQQNAQVEKLCKAYLILWDGEIRLWEMVLEDELQRYNKCIKQIGSESFDLDRLKARVDSPFARKYDTTIFKIEKSRDAENKLLEIKKDLGTISSLFKKLLEAHSEIGKKRPTSKSLSLILEGMNELLAEIK